MCVCVYACVSNAGSILAVLNDPSFEHRQPSWVRRSLHITHRVAPPTIVPATDAAGVRRRRRREGDQVDWGFRGTREVDMETEFVSEREEEQHRAGAPAVRITPPPTHPYAPPECVSVNLACSVTMFSCCSPVWTTLSVAT